MIDFPGARLRILAITAGAANMYCGSCLRDNALARELMRQGHEVTLVLAGLAAPYALVHVARHGATRWLARAATAIGIVVVVAVSARFVIQYDVFYDRYRNFDRMVFFDR